MHAYHKGAPIQSDRRKYTCGSHIANLPMLKRTSSWHHFPDKVSAVAQHPLMPQIACADGRGDSVITHPWQKDGWGTETLESSKVGRIWVHICTTQSRRYYWNPEKVWVSQRWFWSKNEEGVELDAIIRCITFEWARVLQQPEVLIETLEHWSGYVCVGF